MRNTKEALRRVKREGDKRKRESDMSKLFGNQISANH